ncbi:hypothetical protein HanXRQr2_Chr02g0065911 [Helianthus annuus]|uniref:Uncharacterized protein n=1 Tax=Helianthus annuus TaxID=4232 RepID=A0A9K3JNS1_HELAN|nr:hypothetical protein HanXRQr2_Chr02g0065911 [Helianthus annuus]KAJ0951820.1 hypothetical protein HanPSC8_Chr02g0064881 [Helianthus annuus]
MFWCHACYVNPIYHDDELGSNTLNRPLCASGSSYLFVMSQNNFCDVNVNLMSRMFVSSLDF